ncbi:MAG: U32 family peptidase [Bacteroidales bacterium]|nr:U32 family peptidase [Bacteroidales bacterium]
MTRKIELLAPAKNADIGIDAINHGADAVYIGAEQFSARSSAGNSIDEIERLVKYAHIYNAKVYVAFNTVLTDDQLLPAQELIHQLYNIGVDALIVQDMGILKLDIPPIELHASTQTDVRSVEKVKFFEKAGFSQVVLARELSLNQIKEISSQTNVALEIFVHGALCVSYSGQCYISEALSKRSANRGACAQYCRLPYDLTDADNNVLLKSKHLLSMKDMNQSDYLEQLIDAGASSLKIEGRLKDASYVKNITAFYRKKIDDVLKRRDDLKRASSGKCTFFFEPNPNKSFNRGFTNYFLKERGADEVFSFDTPKSIGEYIGTVKEIKKGYFTVAGLVALHNGDGLCFKNENGEFEGFRANKVEENKMFPAEWPLIKPKMKLYRNFDHEFEKELLKKTSERNISLSMTLVNIDNGLKLDALDEDGNKETVIKEIDLQEAKNPQKENIQKQLSKLGNTIFESNDIDVKMDKDYFVPSSLLAEMRRELVEKLQNKRINLYKRREAAPKSNDNPFVSETLTYLGNVTNSKAESFYLEHGVKTINPGFELKAIDNVPLMFTKHCIKYALGWCKKYQNSSSTPKEPLHLVYKENILELRFDCKNCQMQVLRKS